MVGHEAGLEVDEVPDLRFTARIREAVEGNGPLRDVLYSLVLFGSYVRGDYAQGLSDMDFLAVLRWPADEAVSELKAILEEATRSLRPKLVDLPWALVDDVRNPLSGGHPFKFLTFYQKDFLDHHVVVYGEEVAPLLPRLEAGQLATCRARAMLGNLERFRGNLEMMRVQAGEVARFLAVVGGARGIAKQEVLEALRELGDADALAVYGDYVEGKDVARGEEFYRSFIASRLRAFLERRHSTS
jgi:predicted nucleotidyltransferase